MPADNEPQIVSIDAAILRRLQKYAWKLYAETVSPGQLRYLTPTKPDDIYNDIRLAHVALGEVSLCECCGHPTGKDGHSMMGIDFTNAFSALPKDMPLQQKAQTMAKRPPWGFFR